MTILLLLFTLEAGVLPDSDETGFTYVKAEVQIFQYVFVNTDVKTFITKADHTQFTFLPWQADYGFNIGVRPVEWLEAGYRHFCYHPVYNGRNLDKRSYQRSQSEIYITIKGEVELWK